MPTLGFLTGQPELALHWAEPGAEPAHAARTVLGTWQPTGAVGAVGGEPGDSEDLRDLLVVLAAGTTDPAGWPARLVGTRVAALAVPDGLAEPVAVAVARAAAAHGLPLLTLAPTTPVARIERALRDLLRREAERAGHELDELLEQLRRQSGRPEGPARVVAWLARRLGADATLTTGAPSDRPGGSSPSGSPPGGWPPEAWAPPEAAQRLAPARSRIARLLRGSPDPTPAPDRAPEGVPEGAAESGELRLLPFGGHPARAVLAVRRAQRFSAADMRLLTHAETVLSQLLDARDAAVERARLLEVSASLRVAAFQLLMGGQTTLARRTAAPLAPGVLTTDTARVYLVDCGSTDRDLTGQACLAATAGQALVIRCPAHDSQLIVLAPLAPEVALDAFGWCPVGRQLSAVVAERLGHALGGSTTVELTRTADAYREAFNALSVARGLPERRALYRAQTQLAQLLGESARIWAAELLQPMLDLPREQREEVVETTRLALAFSHAQTGRMLDVHRNTVARRIERGVKVLGLDWGDLAARAALDLALQVQARPYTALPASPALPLAGVLGCPPARAWAASFLAPLAQDRRPLLRTLTAWIRAGANARDAPAALGLHHQTVLDHLRSAERLLQRELTAGRSGAHELAWALWITGETPPPPL
ncbi:hypothetical protein GCM10009665_27580 [Kitasatospora nipponensis]|uniref:PucR C-terminal helix-turn-helix domain-containing protein n=1 Tax=Kitasatospora nipponensis TaxID=258049 RepID=A0ABP4GT02_9ACTN